MRSAVPGAGCRHPWHPAGLIRLARWSSARYAGWFRRLAGCPWPGITPLRFPTRMLHRPPLLLPDPDVSALIEAALLDHIPVLQAALTRQFRELWDDQALRKIALGGVPACPNEQDEAYLLIRDYLAPCCDSIEGLDPCGRPARFLALNEQRLEQRMRSEARAAAEQWAQKLLAKLGPITLPRLRFLDEAELTLEALRDKRRVRLDHRRSMKISAKGRVVTRYLGRIYLDGTFVPEARYRQAFH